MSEQTFDKNALTLLQGRVACKLAEIHQMLAPGLTEPFTPEELQAHADRHLASLSQQDQDKLRLKAMVAYAELERLSEEMLQQMDLLAVEIDKVTRYKRANIAYRQAPAQSGLGLASL